MLARRALLAGAAAVAAGCNTVGSSFSPPSLPSETELIWAVLGGFTSLFDPDDILRSDERKLQMGLAALAEDEDNPFGPRLGRYALALRYSQEWPERDPPPETLEEILELFAQWLEGFSADLVALPPILARVLGEQGLLLPLERFMGEDRSKVEAKYFPSVLEQGRGRGGLYALPVGALPLLVMYDSVYFSQKGVPPPDGTWDWNELAANAERLLERNEAGEVTRWGFVVHEQFGAGLWWALWQNEAAIVDPQTLRCLLREPAATEALQFVRDLMHTYRVSPAASEAAHESLWKAGEPRFAMKYGSPPLRPNSRFRWAELPRGKVNAVPVIAGLGISIAARTENAETAYTALRGIVGAMQDFVHVPAERKAVARLGAIRKRFLPDEVTAIQRSMAHGFAIPLSSAQFSAMRSIEEGLARGDDVATAVNTACAVMDEYRESCETKPEDPGCLF